MPSPTAVPRYPLGEYAYQGLWWGAVLLPLALATLRLATAPADMTFALLATIGLPAIIAGQLIAWMLAWSYRRRQWRHWLGPVGAAVSFCYYGAWLVLALALPESRPGDVYPSLVMRALGQGFADGLSSLLFVTIPLLYLSLLGSIIVEGELAVHRWNRIAG
ncbi:hypothetical protein GCM10025789_29590 [Tessaracoccus lubricantis]|uniref:Uncharacterized protein n=1 Tax=Tessaracoccus lubricantis TaxID=545543 RepID=A0ABP9FN29_9ACTN